MATRFQLAELFVELGLVDKNLKKGAQEATYSLSSLGKQALGTAAGFVGAGGIVQAMSTVKNSITNNIKTFADLEKKMAEVGTLVDTQVVGMEGLRDGVIELSSKYGTAPGGLAEALYQTISAGIDAGDALGFLDVATKAAIGGVTDTRTAVDVLTSVINAYGLAASDATTVSDSLFTTVRLGKTTMGELAPVIGRIAPIAAAAGVKIDEMNSALATLTLSGLSTAEAGTAVRGMLNSLIKPTDEARKFAKELGIEFDTAAIKSQGFTKWLENLTVKTGGSTEALSILFPEVRGLNSALQLTSDQGFAKFNQAIGDMEIKAGAADDATAKMRDTLSFQWDVFTTNISNASLGLLEHFIPAVKTATKVLNEFFFAQARSAEQKLFQKALDDSSKTLEEWQDILAESEYLLKAMRDAGGDATAQMSTDFATLEKVTERARREIDSIKQSSVDMGKIEAENADTFQDFIDAQKVKNEQTKEEKEATDDLIGSIKKQKDASADLAKQKAKAFQEDKEQSENENERKRVESELAQAEVKIAQQRAKQQMAIATEVFELQQTVLNEQIEGAKELSESEQLSLSERQEAEANYYELVGQKAKEAAEFQIKQAEIVRDAEINTIEIQKKALQALEKTATPAQAKKLRQLVNDLDSVLEDIEEKFERASDRINKKWADTAEKKLQLTFEAEMSQVERAYQNFLDQFAQESEQNFNALRTGNKDAWGDVISQAYSTIRDIAGMFVEIPDSAKPYIDKIGDLIANAVSGQPVQAVFAGLSIIGQALSDNRRASEYLSEQNRLMAERQKQAAENAREAAKAFLKAAGKTETTLMSMDELVETMEEFDIGAIEAGFTQGIDEAIKDLRAIDLSAIRAGKMEIRPLGAEDIPLLRELGKPITERRALTDAEKIRLDELRQLNLGLNQWSDSGRLQAGQLAGLLSANEDQLKLLREAIRVQTAIELRTVTGAGAAGVAAPGEARVSWREERAYQNLRFQKGEISAEQYATQLEKIAKDWTNSLAPGDYFALMQEAASVRAEAAAKTEAVTAGGAAGGVAGGAADGVTGGATGVTVVRGGIQQVAFEAPSRLRDFETMYGGQEQLVYDMESLLEEAEKAATKYKLGDITAEQYMTHLSALAYSLEERSKAFRSPDIQDIYRLEALDLRDTIQALAGRVGRDSTTGGAGAGLTAGKAYQVQLFPGFAVGEQGAGVDFLQALEAVSGQLAGTALLPDEIDLNVNVNWAGGEITDEQANAVGVAIGEAFKVELRSIGR